MAESNKNSLDDLPDEIILMILSNLDGLADRSNMAQVSHRFNRLTNDKYWRRCIFISMRPSDGFSIGNRCEFVEKLMKEITTSKRLEMLEIEFCHLVFKELFDMIKGKMEELSNLDGTCMINPGYSFSHYMVFLSPKFADDDSGRLIRCSPDDIISIRFDGKETTKLQKILEFSKGFLKQPSLTCPITLPLLRQLGECKRLEEITLIGELILPPNVNKIDLPKISSKIIRLWELGCSQLSDQTSKMASIFFSDILSHIYIPFSLLRGSETEIFSSCPNLKYLKINMGEDADVSDEEFSYFCDKLLSSVANHLLIYELIFLNLNSRLEDILYDSMDTNLTQRPTTRMSWLGGYVLKIGFVETALH